jgi:hypothetical protein
MAGCPMHRGRYAVTRRLRDAESVAPLPAYDDVRVGQPIKVGEALYIVSDRRESRCVVATVSCR